MSQFINTEAMESAAYRMRDAAIEANRAADALEREMQRAEAAEARVKELEAQLNKRIDAYMNEPHCCSGRECGCMGVTRFEQIVGEELGQRMATMREKNARLRAALVRLDNIYRSELDGEDAPKRPAWLIAALNGEEAST